LPEAELKGCMMRDWKQELDDLLTLSKQHQQANTAVAQQNHTALVQFFIQIVVPAFELLCTELLQRQRDAAVRWSGTPSLTTDLSATFILYPGAPRSRPPSLSEPAPSERDDHTKRRGLGAGLDLEALLPPGPEEFAYTLGVRQDEKHSLLVAESRYIEHPTGQRHTLEQPFPHGFSAADLKQITTTEIIQHVLSTYRAHLERAKG
jgi:hypothetical protein